MTFTDSEKRELKTIQNTIIKKLKDDEEYQKLKVKRTEVLNLLERLKKDEKEKDALKKYEQIGEGIKKIEIEKAYRVATDQKKESEKNKRSLINFIKTIIRRKQKAKQFSEEFNKIVKDEEYKNKSKERKDLFRILIKTNQKEQELLYELESLEIQMATIETELMRKYVEKVK